MRRRKFGIILFFLEFDDLIRFKKSLMSNHCIVPLAALEVAVSAVRQYGASCRDVAAVPPRQVQPHVCGLALTLFYLRLELPACQTCYSKLIALRHLSNKATLKNKFMSVVRPTPMHGLVEMTVRLGVLLS